jgi:hypothetical protein
MVLTMRISIGSCCSFAGALGALAGCAEAPPPLPAKVPSYALDVDACEVHAMHATDAEEIKGWVTGAINDAVTERGDTGVAKRARYLAVVNADDSALLWPVLAIPTVIGPMFVPANVTKAEVTLTLEIDGRRFVGRGEGSTTHGFYRSAGGAADEAWHDAVVEGTRAALANVMLEAKGARR